MDIATSESIKLPVLRSSPGRDFSSANAMPVSSGRVEDAKPTTATLRAGIRSLFETKAALMRPSSFRDPQHQCPARFYRVLCRVYIPLSISPILLAVKRVACLPNRLASSRRHGRSSSGPADLVLVALFAPRSRPPPAHPRRATRAGPPPDGPVRSTLERTGPSRGGLPAAGTRREDGCGARC